MHKIKVRNAERKSPLVKPKRIWEDTIKMDIIWGVDWIHLAEDTDHW
jgi:hypothetical protein